MEKPLPAPVPSAASKEVAEQFRSFVDPDDVASIKQMQHLMFQHFRGAAWEVNFPKTKKTCCKNKECRKHNVRKVT